MTFLTVKYIENTHKFLPRRLEQRSAVTVSLQCAIVRAGIATTSNIDYWQVIYSLVVYRPVNLHSSAQWRIYNRLCYIVSKKIPHNCHFLA